MENLGLYMVYVVEGIFVLALLFAGGLSCKFPLKYQTALDYIVPDGKYYGKFLAGYPLRYPYYSSKRALSDKEKWDFAQKTYGKYLLLSAVMQTVIGVFWYQIAEFAISITKWDDAGMIIIICPVFVFILMSNVLTEIRIKRL